MLTGFSSFQEDENFLSTPMDDRWLQDRRVYSVCPSNHKIPLRHNVMMKFDHYTQFYTLPQDAECVSTMFLLIFPMRASEPFIVVGHSTVFRVIRLFGRDSKVW